jgi:hypothetical protein
MALKLFTGDLQIAFNTETRKLHYVSVAADGTVTDLGALLQDIGATITADVIDADLFAVTGGNGGNPGTGGKSLKDIDTRLANIPAQGQALAAASMPVVLPEAQIATLTPPAAITGFALESGGNLAAIARASLGTGNPIPRQFTDPASDDYTAAATAPGRACTRIRFGCTTSGMIISLDGGTTESIRVLPNTVDEIAVSIPADAAIKVKRYTAGVAFADAFVEVR